jgi:hypothetical protein
MSKNPEMKRPSLKIKWGTCVPLASRLGPNMFSDNRDANTINRTEPVNAATDPNQMPLNTVNPKAQQNVSSMDSLSNVHDGTDPRAESITDRKKIGLGDLAKDTLGSIADDIKDTAEGLVSGVTNAIDSFSLQPNGIGNVHGTKIGGFAGTLLDNAVGNLTGKLLLDNVHGAGGLGSIQDAINGGLINAVGNLIQGQLNSGGSAASALGGGGSGIGDQVHDIGVDSSPDGNLGNAKVHDPVTPTPEGPLNQRIHPPGVDSTPDGNLNNNVHE